MKADYEDSEMVLEAKTQDPRIIVVMASFQIITWEMLVDDSLDDMEV